MTLRRPDLVQRTFELQIIAGDTGAREAHRSILAAPWSYGGERGRVETDRILGIEPGDQVVNLLLERGRIVIAQDRARVVAAAAVAGQMNQGEPGRLGAAGGEHFAFVPLETPQRGAEPVLSRINRD